MTNEIDFSHDEAIEKLQQLVSDIGICMFCTNLNTNDGSTSRPMEAQNVCDQGNIWFFSERYSDKNIEIAADEKVQLIFSHPGQNSYLIVNGEGEMVLDQIKVDELWSPLDRARFSLGKNDPTLSIIKVVPTSAYYWEMEGNRMINFLKKMNSMATGANPIMGNQGVLNL